MDCHFIKTCVPTQSGGRVSAVQPGLHTGDGVTLALSDGVTLALSDGVTLALSDGVMLALSDGVMLALSDGVMLALSDGVIEALSLGVGDWLGQSNSTSAAVFTGELVLPRPSCPAVFRPQHCISPLDSRAHVCDAPACRDTAEKTPDTTTGILELVVLPSPSWPLSFKPQQRTVPSVRSAQEWVFPQDNAMAPVRPDTVTGMAESDWKGSLFPS